MANFRTGHSQLTRI
nr:unnamed protein product [Callosobruchus chinensis]